MVGPKTLNLGILVRIQAWQFEVGSDSEEHHFELLNEISKIMIYLI